MVIFPILLLIIFRLEIKSAYIGTLFPGSKILDSRNSGEGYEIKK